MEAEFFASTSSTRGRSVKVKAVSALSRTATQGGQGIALKRMRKKRAPFGGAARRRTFGVFCALKNWYRQSPQDVHVWPSAEAAMSPFA